MTKFLIQTGVRGISLALLSIGGIAHGQGIIYGQPSQPINYSAGITDSSTDIDINGDGTPDFTIISTSGYSADIAPLGNNSLLAIPETPPDIGYFLAALNGGDTINSLTPIPPLAWYNNQTDGIGSAGIGAQAGFDGVLDVLGNFTGKASAYVGFDLVNNGENYYGWIQLSNPAPFVAGQIIDWAFESAPNTPITAGAVPEPATASLLALSGFSFWLMYRKRLAKVQSQPV